MIPILSAILSGILVGYFTRDRSFHQYTGTILSVIIGLLLFFLGLSVGSNEEIMHNFPRVGWDALVLTMGGTVGSLLAARYVFIHFFKK